MKWMLLLVLMPVSLLAQPSNDDCENAILLNPSSDISCSSITGSNIGVVSGDYDACIEFEKRNVWYRFVATSGTHIVQVTFGTMQQGIIDVFSGDCGSLSNVSTCNSGSAGPVIENVLSGLTIGTEYKITVSTREETDEGTFDICVITPPAPANDDCANAATLSINPSNVPVVKTSGTTKFASQSLPGCIGTADDDVWYNFTATQTSHRIFLFYTGNTLAMESFSGTCDALVSMSCSEPIDLFKTALLSGLTIGENYLIRIYSTSASPSSQQAFEISITSAPLNDNCEAAQSITPSPAGHSSCSTITQGSSFDATLSSLDCFGTTRTDDDVWFQFTATQGVHKIKLWDFPSNSEGFQVFRNSCAALESFSCNSATFSGDTLIQTLSGLTTGEPYFIRAFSSTTSGNQALFSICVSSPVFPDNDECAQAIVLTPSLTGIADFTQASTINATNSNITAGCNSFASDVWFSFEASAQQHLVKAINLSNNSDLKIELYSGSCGSLVHQRCSAASDTTFGLGNLTPGEIYLIRIYNNANALGNNFKIAVTTPDVPSNDECTNAITIIPTSDATCNEIGGTIAGATQSQKDNCGGNALLGQLSDVWYKFEAIATSHRVRLIKGTGELQFQFLGGNCSSQVNLGCSAENSGDLVGAGKEVRYDGLTIGDTYFIRVLNTSPDETGTFDLCVKSVVIPANNECATPTTLLPQNTITFGQFTSGNTTDATQSSQPTECSTGHDDDVWYQFTATQSNMQIVLQNGSIGSTRLSVYSGDCSSLDLVKCQTGNSRDNVVSLTGLTIDDIYRVRVFSSSTSASAQGTFSIMVTTQYSPPENDDCINATELFPSSINSCIASTAGSTIDAGASGNTACGNGNEVWYRFIATGNSHRINVDGFVFTPQITAFSGSCAGLVQLPSSCAVGTSGAYVTAGGLTIGDTYFIKVLTNSNESFKQSTFNICITTPQVPVNDECSNAITLPVNNNPEEESSQTFTTNMATFTGIPNCAVASNDVWFSFTAPAEPVTIELTTLNTEAGIELLSGTCGALSSVVCNGTSATDVNNILNADNLQEGNVYFLRVSSTSFADALEFRIKVYRNPLQMINDTIDPGCLLPNLVQNPGLERSFVFSSASFIAAANPGFELMDHWRTPTRGTSDYFTSLTDNGSAVEVPNNLCFGAQSPRNGYGYGGFFAFSSGSGYREYLENELSEPMTIGKKYLVSLYVSLSDFSTIAIDNIGLAFQTNSTQEVTFSNLDYTPLVVSPDDIFIADKKAWVNISGVITADQAYEYIIIGNFSNNSLTDTVRVSDPSGRLSGGTFAGCASTNPSAYYFVDDVVVAEIDESAGSPCGSTVVKQDQTITFGALSPVTVGDVSFALNATASSGLTVTYASSDPAVATISGNIVTIVGAGTSNITASQSGDVNFNAAADVQQLLTVNKQDQTITFNVLTPVTIGDAPFDLDATASSGLAVTYVSSDPLVASITGNTVTIVGVGTTMITASQAGNDTFNAAEDVSQQLTVNATAAVKQDQTITFNALTPVTIGDAPFDLDATASSGLAVTYVSSDPLVASITGNTVTIVGVGTTTITASQAGNDTFNAAEDVSRQLTVNATAVVKQDQTITFNALAPVTIGDAPFDLDATASSGLAVTYVSSDPLVASITGNTVTIVGVGTTTITASQAGNDTFNAAEDVSQQLTVNSTAVVKQDQTITFNALTPVTIGDEPFDLGATASSGLAVTYVSSDPLVASITGNTVTVVGVGTTTITASQAGNDTFNAAEDVSQQLTVNSMAVVKQDQTITFSPLSDVQQNAGNIVLTASSTSGLPVSFTSSDLSRAIISGNNATITGAGLVTFTAKQAGDDNFNAAPDISQTICIIPDKPSITGDFTDTEKPVLTSSSLTGNQWFVDGVLLPEATQNTVTVNSEGVYTTQVTLGGCTSEIADGFVVLVTGLEESTVTGLFPNPVNDELTLVTPENGDLIAVQIFNSVGQSVSQFSEISTGKIKIKVDNMLPGIYFMIVVQGARQYIYRFSKK